MESLISIHGHKEDPNDKATLQREIGRWSWKYTSRQRSPNLHSAREGHFGANILLSQLGFNIHQDPKLGELLAQQVMRWSWEVQNVQTSGSKLHLAYHPVRTAWLWMEEYGAEIWPEEAEKRGHLDSAMEFVYLHDRSTPSELRPEQRLDVDGNIAGFCFSKGKLHPYNSMFQSVLQCFAGVYAGLWDIIAYTTYGDATAAELMTVLLGTEPWIPQREFLPLFYVALYSGWDEDCESVCGECSECSESSTCSWPLAAEVPSESSRTSSGTATRSTTVELRPGNSDRKCAPGSPMSNTQD